VAVVAVVVVVVVVGAAHVGAAASYHQLHAVVSTAGRKHLTCRLLTGPEACCAPCAAGTAWAADVRPCGVSTGDVNSAAAAAATALLPGGQRTASDACAQGAALEKVCVLAYAGVVIWACHLHAHTWGGESVDGPCMVRILLLYRS
jgi:hypothetical protein